MEKEDKTDPITLRINDLIAKLKLTKAQFAAHIGVSQPIITHITTGRNKPGLEVIQRILAGYETISADWLITGKGDMFRSGGSAEKEEMLRQLASLEQKVTASARELRSAGTLLESLQNRINAL